MEIEAVNQWSGMVFMSDIPKLEYSIGIRICPCPLSILQTKRPLLSHVTRKTQSVDVELVYLKIIAPITAIYMAYLSPLLAPKNYNNTMP